MNFGSARTLAAASLYDLVDLAEGASCAFDVGASDWLGAKVSVALDGLGSGSGPVTVTARLKDGGGATIGETLPVVVEDGQEEGVVDLAFPSPPPRWSYDGSSVGSGVEMHVEDGTASSARVGTVDSGGTVAAIAALIAPWEPPAEQDDLYLARLPFAEAQANLGLLGARFEDSGVHATVGWHGTLVDRDRGSFAVVKAGGALESLLGSRVRITVPGVRPRHVYAYVSSAGAVEQDITVTRRLFQTLAPLGRRQIGATVQEVRRA